MATPVLGTEEVQRQYPAELQSDIRRYLALARDRGVSRENTLWLISFAGCVEGAIARLKAAELPGRQRLN